MYAIVEQGSKQYKVSQGDKINIELVDLADGADTLEMEKVLMVSDGENVKVGTPYIDGAKVVAKLSNGEDDSVVKGPKVYPAQFRRRKNSRRRIGHRQKYLSVVIESINV
ncbi:50S ribosomal protein L21 [Limihaloglobus sulfuriphilus]|uniref:Large ribosomal subunit protein bL21 n=1 Tax=Limihaloglobus sulfuriphilus TaxID=1851148 RepID=A0A1R7T5X6_9BACT|nr:50S ribosomal protein L21 [Limihaloglobus sulfuriphilus]AQQ71946.1 50S ribosomal protein L21 [Limihaloglobus sulfuriphilus]